MPIYKFVAETVEDRDEWIAVLRDVLPDKHGSTVKWKNQYETWCGYWFITVFIAMIVVFVIGSALKLSTNIRNKWVHSFCIPLSLYSFILVILYTVTLFL